MHNRLNESRGGAGPATPILMQDGIFPINDVMNRLKSNVDLLDDEIKEIMFDKLKEYSSNNY